MISNQELDTRADGHAEIIGMLLLAIPKFETMSADEKMANAIWRVVSAITETLEASGHDMRCVGRKVFANTGKDIRPFLFGNLHEH